MAEFQRPSRQITDAIATVLDGALDDYMINHGMPATTSITVGLLTTQITFEDGTVVWLTTEVR